MKKAIIFTVFVLFSLNVGTLMAADWTDGAEGAIYYNGGKVGIGTTEPAYQLDIKGTFMLKDDIDDRGILYTRTSLNSSYAGRAVKF